MSFCKSYFLNIIYVEKAYAYIIILYFRIKYEDYQFIFKIFELLVC